jgi:hypothetical protein
MAPLKAFAEWIKPFFPEGIHFLSSDLQLVI